MAGESALLQVLKRAKVRQDANRNPTRQFVQKMRNSRAMSGQEERTTGVDGTIDAIPGEQQMDIPDGQPFDKSKSRITQSEDQDQRGVPDQEFDQLKERDKPGAMLHERFPNPEERLLAVLRARGIAGSQQHPSAQVADFARRGQAVPQTTEEQVKAFFGNLPQEDRESLLYELLGGTSRSPE